jgi:hypothetical protein
VQFVPIYCDADVTDIWRGLRPPLSACVDVARADEGGVWIPGNYGSLAATPQVPGWALGVI